MICRILLLISLTSCVSGAFVVNVTQSSYQAEENNNITLEWMFTAKPESSSTSLHIYCQLFTDHNDPVLYHVDGGVEVPESQDEHFAGRVQSDKDALREGRIRLHVSRLRTDDSGLYECEVITDYGSSSDECFLNVTAAVDQPKPQKPTVRPQPESRGRIGLYIGLIGAGLALCVGLCLLILKRNYFQSSGGFKKTQLIFSQEEMDLQCKQNKIVIEEVIIDVHTGHTQHSSFPLADR
ncbi:uncharacterized protein LOC128383556 [Scomber scombrus]